LALLFAKQLLDQALLRYTEEHPKVQELKARVASIETQLATQRGQIEPEIALQESSLAKNLYTKLVELRTEKVSLGKQLEKVDELRSRLTEKLTGLPERQLSYLKLKSHYDSLKTARGRLLDREEETRLIEANAAGSYRILELPKVGDWERGVKLKTGLLFGAGVALLGFLAVGAFIVVLDLSDKRIRSAADLERITSLPVLATLGDLQEMSDVERERWAFKTLTALKAKLRGSSGAGLMCGFISSRPGEGRSTWINLLATAASKQGYRVLTIVTNRFGPSVDSPAVPAESEERSGGALSVPFEITQALVSAAAQPVVEIPLPGWVWSLERRKQWQQALRELNHIHDLVVLVELPPASEPEAVLLSENFSQLIWLCGKDMADAAETDNQLETLRQCQSRLVGAVLNRATTSIRKKRRSYATAVGLLMLGLFVNSLGAQTVPPTGTNSTNQNENLPGSLSITSPNQLADWQKRFTLGPGDSLSITLFDQPDTARAGLFIGPDGRLTYLQARDVMATGLTVDELREKLEDVLSKYYRPPLRAIILPEAYRSKKYYMLGGVVQKGVFALDRPITLLEAIARARGFEGSQRTSLLPADLSRSFLVRKREDNSFTNITVDFEALFMRGDLSQNIALAPDDYLYFPPLASQDVYLLGEVRTPGPVPYTPETTVLRAIISRGGFTDRAYKKKIVIIRGSLSQPQTFVVNASDILSARTTDVDLQPRDIVYVHHRPWNYVRELLKSAITEYTRAIIITWTGQNVGPFTKEPFIPGKGNR
jgi:protein involved in polysaccharide export with SLBB domain/Mrp family chromosome partitioning ATPase